MSETSGGDLPRGVYDYPAVVASDAQLMEALERATKARDKLRKDIAEKKAADKARWEFYKEQLAKHTPFGGAERGGLLKDRWD